LLYIKNIVGNKILWDVGNTWGKIENNIYRRGCNSM